MPPKCAARVARTTTVGARLRRSHSAQPRPLVLSAARKRALAGRLPPANVQRSTVDSNVSSSILKSPMHRGGWFSPRINDSRRLHPAQDGFVRPFVRPLRCGGTGRMPQVACRQRTSARWCNHGTLGLRRSRNDRRGMPRWLSVTAESRDTLRHWGQRRTRPVVYVLGGTPPLPGQPAAAPAYGSASR